MPTGSLRMRFNLRSLFCWVTIAAIVILLLTTLRNRHLARWKHSKTFQAVESTVSELQGVMKDTVNGFDRVESFQRAGGSVLSSSETSSYAIGTAAGAFQHELESTAWQQGVATIEWRISISGKLTHNWDWRVNPPHRLEMRHPDDAEHGQIVDAVEQHLNSRHENLVIVRIPEVATRRE